MLSSFSIRVAITAMLFAPCFLSAQAPAKWSVSGNALSNGDQLGSTNSQPVIFIANNTEVMRIKANGELKVNSLGGSGRGLIATNNNGLLSTMYVVKLKWTFA